MKTPTREDFVYLVDAFISKANSIAKNLIFDPASPKGKFTFQLFSLFTPEQLEKLNKEASKKDPCKDLYLVFYCIPEGATTCPTEIRDFESFDLNKIVDIKFSGDTAPYQFRKSDPFAYQYLSVVLVVKA